MVSLDQLLPLAILLVPLLLLVKPRFKTKTHGLQHNADRVDKYSLSRLVRQVSYRYLKKLN